MSSIRARLASAGYSRPLRGRLIAGVIAGLAGPLGVNKWVLRAIFVGSILLPGPQFVIYIALWLLMPEDRPAYGPR